MAILLADFFNLPVAVLHADYHHVSHREAIILLGSDVAESFDGFSVHLPQYGDLSKDDWTGIGFQARLSTADLMTASYIISGGYNVTIARIRDVAPVKDLGRTQRCICVGGSNQPS